MKKLILIVYIFLLAATAKAQLLPLVGIMPGPDTNYILITRDSLGADRFIYKEITFNISGDTLYFMDDISAKLGDIDNANADKLLHGAVDDRPVITVSSNGSTVTLDLDDSVTSDSLELIFSSGRYQFDIPADVELTAGSDASPTMNYVYILESTKALTVSTSDFPPTEHVPIATVYCQSESSIQTDGPYKVHAWTDHLTGGNQQGHLSHLNYWIRSQNATWIDGVTITPSLGSSQFDIATTAGTVLQLHEHSYPAFNSATGSDLYIVNDYTTAYKKVGDLVGELTDAEGNSMNNKYFNIVVWGVVSEADSDSKLMINLPAGIYSNSSEAETDVDNTAIYDISQDFRGTGFLIARLTVREQGSNNYTLVATEDLRGILPGKAGGAGGGSLVSEFADNAFKIYDESDVTKILELKADNITTATTRTLTIPDSSGTIALLSNITSLWEESGSDIYYDAGNVAVGTSTIFSQSTLNVDGGIGLTFPAGSGKYNGSFGRLDAALYENFNNSITGNYNYAFGGRNAQSLTSASYNFISGYYNLRAQTSSGSTFVNGSNNGITGNHLRTFINGDWNIGAGGSNYTFVNGFSNASAATSTDYCFFNGADNADGLTTPNSSFFNGYQNGKNATAGSSAFLTGSQNAITTTGSIQYLFSAGHQNGKNTTNSLNNTILIGYRQGYTGGGAYELHIGQYQDAPLIYGEFDTELLELDAELKALQYGSGTFTGTPTYFAAFDTNGDIIERTPAEVLSDIGGGGYWTQSGTDLYYTTGEVGIGEAAPTNQLEVKGATTATASFENTTTASYLMVYNSATGTSGLADGLLIGQTSANAIIHNKENGYLSLGTNGNGAAIIEADADFGVLNTGRANYRLWWDATDEYFGIGTDSPNYQLHSHENSSGANYLQFSNTTTGSTSSDGAQIGLNAQEELIINTLESNKGIYFAVNSSDAVAIAGDGDVGIGTTSPDASAALEIDATDGGLLLPRMSTTQRNTITATNGLIIYNTTTNKFQGYAGGAWTDLH